MLEVYGVDLAAWLRARRYRGVLDLIDQLPAASRTMAALLNDPTVARDIVAAESETGGGSAPEGPSLRDETPEVQMLRVLINDFRAAMSDKKRKPKLLPSPKTAIEKARREYHRDAANGIMAKMMPGVKVD